MAEEIIKHTEDIPEHENQDEKDKSNSEDSDSIEVIPDEILEGIPVEERSKIKSIISQTMFSGVMKRSNPISEKITSEHITKLIDNSNIQDDRDRKERKSDKNYQIIFLLIGLLFIGFLIVFLKDNEDLLYKIIIAIISFVGGFGIGKANIIKPKSDND